MVSFPARALAHHRPVHYLEPFPRWLRTTFQMREMLHILRRSLIEFEEWFDLRFGWFFTNGMKHRSPERSLPEEPSADLRPL